MVEEGAGGGVEGSKERDFGKGDAVGYNVVSAVRWRSARVLWISVIGMG